MADGTSSEAYANFFRCFPFEKAFKKDLFIYTGHSFQWFAVNTYATVIQTKPVSLVCYRERKKTIEKLNKFNSANRIFHISFNPTDRGRKFSKKLAKDFHCNVLGYSSVLVQKKNAGNAKTARHEEMRI